MSKILELREKRARLWQTAKDFLDSKRGADGLVSAEDAATYDKMEADMVALGKEIERLERQAMLMLHDPSTIAIGNAGEMQKAIEMLAAVKDAIITAYEIKTSLSRAKLSKLMAAESWLYAEDAIKLGFADGLIEDAKKLPMPVSDGIIFSRAAVTNSLLDKVRPKTPGVPADALTARLQLILH